MAVLITRNDAAGRQPMDQATPTRTPHVKLQTIRQGFDGRTCWVQVRGGIIPDGLAGAKLGVITMQPLHLEGSDLFEGISMMLSRDGGGTWKGRTEQPTLRRWPEADRIEACVCDFTPAWHAVRGTMLGTGHRALYKGDASVSEWVQPIGCEKYGSDNSIYLARICGAGTGQ